MTLKDIELSEAQQEELKNKLQSWKLAEKRKMEAELTERYEQMEADLKEEYEDIVEEIKGNMKKVYTKRFQSALKEMYEEIKAQVMVESMKSPENAALEEIKTLVYPLINEASAKRYRNEFTKLAEMYELVLDEHQTLKGSLKKAQLMESLSPDVRKVVDKLIGEGTEQEVVEKFASIQTALKEQVASKRKDTLEEDIEEDTEDFLNEDTEEEEIVSESSFDEEDYEEKEDLYEENKSEFSVLLEEQLKLAGIRK